MIIQNLQKKLKISIIILNLIILLIKKVSVNYRYIINKIYSKINKLQVKEHKLIKVRVKLKTIIIIMKSISSNKIKKELKIIVKTK